jgi:hypothetical protein
MPNPPERLNRGELARFMRYTHQDGATGCLLWQGPTMPNGYGKHRRSPGHAERAAHRILWEHVNGPIPDGLQLDHRCRTRNCVLPEHLEPVSASENTKRQDHAERRVTQCPQGHPYDEENTRITTAGKRACRACDSARKHHSRASRVTTSATVERR